MAQIYASPTDEISEEELRHMNQVRKWAGECVVLLENDGVLPLEKRGNLALYGTGARRTIKGGTGSGDVNSRMVCSIEQGLEDAGFQITTTAWLDRYDAFCEKRKKEHREWIAEKAKEENMPEVRMNFLHPLSMSAPIEIISADLDESKSDTAVYVIARNSGEAADRHYERGDYLFFQEEIENLKVLVNYYKNVVVILNIGGVMDLSELGQIAGIRAILLMSQLGNIGGLVLADVLTGKVTPSGKLTDTWAEDYMQYPSSKTFSHNDGDVDDEYYTEGVYVGYRYFDTSDIQPLYPFGYGKSYTEFEIGPVEVDIIDSVKLTVTVTNTGKKYAGQEVVQVYYSAPAGKIDKPYQELVTYKKTKPLKPGESEELYLDFVLGDMASYSEALSSWVLEKGTYVIRVGNDSKNTKIVKEIHIAQDMIVEKLHPVFKGNQEGQQTGEKSSCQTDRTIFVTNHTKTLTADDVRLGNCTVEELVAQLTVEEMATLCVGTLRANKQTGSIVGAASTTIPGAAGDTSGILEESRGIGRIIMADGPAGLRLQPHFKTTKTGDLIPGGNVIGDYKVPFPEDLDEENVIDYYQYCTAIPIGWALAQSWNLDMIESVGAMIGSEMEKFHIDLWLAPALNIHRNPLCGRNFEYYSEDPFISGKVAAAMTKGVQSHAGKGVVIKHLAANNQEANRYFTNSHISERTLREIYLKGFEIAVKESAPWCMMTSYNLLNGIHTANSYDLLQMIARDEWGFDGAIMTDWYTSQHVSGLTGNVETKYPISSSVGCIYAGNDLQMPGCEENVEDIIRAVKNGEEVDGYRIRIADLQYCAANMIRMVLKI